MYSAVKFGRPSCPAPILPRKELACSRGGTPLVLISLCAESCSKETPNLQHVSLSRVMIHDGRFFSHSPGFNLSIERVKTARECFLYNNEKKKKSCMKKNAKLAVAQLLPDDRSRRPASLRDRNVPLTKRALHPQLSLGDDESLLKFRA
jgi:hypothetical protein